MFKRLSLITLILSAWLLAGCTSGAPTRTSELPDEIKIGFIGPLTGNVASFGQDYKKGIELYFRENPTISGKPVRMIWEDGRCNGQDASNAARKLVDIDKVEVVLGGQCSGEILAAAPIGEANQVVMISSFASNPSITDAGDYIFRNYPSDARVARTMVDVLTKDEGFTKIAVLSEQTDYCQGFRKAIRTHLKADGNEDYLVVDEAFPVDNTDFRSLLQKIRESGAQVLVAIGQSPVTDGFMVRQARETGMSLPIYSTDTAPGPDFFNTAKDAAEGVKVVMVVEDSSRGGYQDFTRRLGSVQSGALFAAFGYDGARVIASAIENAGYDGTAIKNYLYRMPRVQGLASDIKFDENGDNPVDSGVLIGKNGEFVIFKKP